ncbi:4'-phosphopantetheinyl transferase family protein [Arenimonas aestuarii]
MAGQPRLTMRPDEPHPLLLANPLATGLAIRALRLNPRHFTDDDFARHGVAQPSELYRAGCARRCEFLAGRRCAQSALESLGCGRPNIPIGAGGAPDWPTGCNGSISHSASWATAVVSTTQRVRPGIDCESIIGVSAFRDMVELVAAEGELESAERTLGDRHLALTLLFSAKESAFKSLPPEERAGCSFLSFRVVIAGDIGAGFEVRDVRPHVRTCSRPGLYARLDQTTILTLVVSNPDAED